MTLSTMIASACGRESTIEDLALVLAARGAFDRYLPPGSTRCRVVRGRRGHADVEVLDAAGRGLVGIEVKPWSAENWGYYGLPTYRSQLDVSSEKVAVFVLVTTPHRAATLEVPPGTVLLTLDDLAAMAQEYAITAEDVIRVGLGHAA